MKPSKDVVAENVRRFRLARGWSQEDLATRAEIAQSAVSFIENARGGQTTETIDRLAEALSVAPAMLLTPIEEPAQASA